MIMQLMQYMIKVIINYFFYDKENSLIKIDFSDNGEGIPKNKINNIFTPIFTTRTLETGLGLAMSIR